MIRIPFLLIMYLTIYPFILSQGCMKSVTSEQIRENLVAVSRNVETYSYEMEMYMETSITGEDSVEIVNSNRNAHVDVKNNRMKISTNIDERTTDKTQAKSTRTEIYILDTMEYLFLHNRGKDGHWVKFEVPGNKFDNENRLKKQMELLISSKTKTLGDESLGNIDCYLLSIEPDKEAFWKVIMEQEEEHPLLKLFSLDYGDVVKEMDMKVWLAKDTFLPVKCCMQMKAVIETEIMNELFKITIKVKTAYRYHDHNKLLAIELPEEAKNAEIYEEED
jgi:hypothetical protein